MNKAYREPFSIIGTALQGDMDIAISQKARLQGLYIIGATGTGKSTLLANLILNDIRQGMGVCLIEPHGDLTNTVLAGIPDRRFLDVLLLFASTCLLLPSNAFRISDKHTLSEKPPGRRA